MPRPSIRPNILGWWIAARPSGHEYFVVYVLNHSLEAHSLDGPGPFTRQLIERTDPAHVLDANAFVASMFLSRV